MLQNEHTDPPAVPPTAPLPVPSAADARVTPDELNAALKALEDRQNSTVAIGSVVDELRLNATPEQIWEQVQAQRAQAEQQKAQQAEGQSSVRVRVTVNGQAAVPPATGRRRMRAWRDIKGWGWILFWCGGGLGLFSGLPHLLHPAATNSGQTITITADETTETLPVQDKDVVIAGDDDKITLQGQARSVTVSGDNVHLRGDAPKAFDLTGDGGDVQWTQNEPHPGTAFRPSP